jgi:glutaminase
MDLQATLDRISREVRPLLSEGQVAAYIPELAKVPREQFAMAVTTLDGQVYRTGCADQPFSIQSISKLFAVTRAFQLHGDDLWKRMGREPSGTPFNSLVQLEYERGKPRNPLINAGALVVTDILCGSFDPVEAEVVAFMRRLCGNESISYDVDVAQSELATAARNRALANLIKSFGNLDHPTETVIRAYVRQCAIAMSAVDLSRAICFLAHRGTQPFTGEVILDGSSARRLSALMLTCGTYDAAGDFAYRVGLPAKSGVGGGIVAHVPGEMGICVWSPGLSESGNSLAGWRALELFTTYTSRSIF